MSLYLCFSKNTYNDELLNDTQDAIEAGLEGTPYAGNLFSIKGK